jgi:hypothetical protein
MLSITPLPTRARPSDRPTAPGAPCRILPFRRSAPPAPPAPPAAGRRQSGQATTEYALVLLAAAAIALLLIAWATRTGAIGDLFDAVLDSIKHKV